MSHEISEIDLGLGAVERHQEEVSSWHNLEKVRENLSVENCGLREINVKTSNLVDDGQDTGFRLPYVQNPIAEGKLYLSDRPFDRETYELFTPVEFVDFVGMCLKEAGLEQKLAFTTTLFSGKCQTVAIHIPDADFTEGKGDYKVRTYANFLNSLNGKWPLFVNTSETRTVCNNTATSNLHRGGASCKHRPDAIRAFIKRFPTIFADAITTHKNSANDYLKLAGLEMSKEQAQAFFAALLTTDRGEETRISKMVYNLATDTLLSLFVKGAGNFGVSAADAYNAVTDHYTHSMTLEANAPGGTADNYKREAKAALLLGTEEKTVAKYQAMIERGKKLLADCA